MESRSWGAQPSLQDDLGISPCGSLGAWQGRHLIRESSLWPGREPAQPEIRLAQKSCHLQDEFMLWGPPSSILHTGRPDLHDTRYLLPRLPAPARSQVTCVKAPLGAACPSYGEAAVTQVTEVGEGGGGVDGVSPGSEGICG